MRGTLADFTPSDIAAILTIGGCIFLMWAGREVAPAESVLMMAAGFMFGKHTNKKR